MKKKLFIVLGVLLVLGLCFTACSSDDDGPTDPFKGTWTGTVSGRSTRIVAGDEKMSAYFDSTEGLRGTYTFSGNTATGKWNQINLGAFGEPGSWANFSDLTAAEKAQFGGETFTITINGTTFTMLGATFTKQP